MRKRGALVASEIVIWTLVVLGFALVIYFLASLGLNDKTDDELCRLSILTRATAPTEAQGIVPLNCYTKKICLTMDKSKKCEEQFAGEKVQVVKLPKNEKEAVEEIEKQTVEAFYNCWDISGKGRFDLFGSWAGSRSMKITEPVCILCSRVAIDKSVNENLIKKADVYDYMKKTKIPRKTVTYWDELNTGNKFNAYTGDVKENWKGYVGGMENVEDNRIKIEGSNLNRELVILFSQVKITDFEDSVSNLGKDALVVGGAVLMTPGVGGIATKLVLWIGGLKMAAFGAAAAAATTAYAAYNVWQGQDLASAYCGKFATNVRDEELNKGCSLVSVVPYTVKSVNQMCPQIEGWP